MVPPTILCDGLMTTISFSDILRLNFEDFSRSRKFGIAGSLVSSKLSDGTDVEVVEDEDVVEESRSDVVMSLEHLAVSGISFPQIKG